MDISAVGTINNFILTGEHRVTPQVIKYDSGSNINCLIQDPPNKNHIKIFHNNLLLVALTLQKEKYPECYHLGVQVLFLH
jgi:hypothetical protein